MKVQVREAVVGQAQQQGAALALSFTQTEHCICLRLSSAPMHLFAGTFTSAIIPRLQAAAAEPGLTSSALSRHARGWLEWFGADGRAREVSCRKRWWSWSDAGW